MYDMFFIKVYSLSPKSESKNVSYPGKKIPRLTQNEIPRPNPTRPENIL